MPTRRKVRNTKARSRSNRSRGSSKSPAKNKSTDKKTNVAEFMEKEDPMVETRAELDLMFNNMVQDAINVAEKSGAQMNMILIDTIVSAVA